MNNQLIPVFVGCISNETSLLCNARDLHQFLGVRRDFSTWINDRISEYGFTINLDYIVFSPNSGKTVGRKKKEYHLTLDTAKELAMVERNEKGREVRRYFIDCEKQLINHGRQAKYSTSEPLSNKQQEQVKRLVWCASHNMKFSQSWSSAIWKSLRSVTGRTSPQPFTIDDIPAINQEIERIMKITAATHNAMYDFEKQVIGLVVRKRQDMVPILNDMRLEFLEIQKRESEGKLMLEKWDKRELGILSI